MRHRPRRPFQPSRRIRRTPDATFPRARSSAIRICIPLLDGRGSVRLPAQPARRVPLRQRRGDHRIQSKQRGEALAPARFPRRRGSLGRLGILPGPVRVAIPKVLATSARAQMVRHDQCPARAPQAAVDIITQFRQGTIAEGAHVRCPARRLSLGVAAKPSRPPTRRTTPAASPRSSAIEWTSQHGRQQPSSQLSSFATTGCVRAGRALHHV